MDARRRLLAPRRRGRARHAQRLDAIRNFRRVGKGTRLRAVPTCGRAANTDRGESVLVGTRPKRAALPTLQESTVQTLKYSRSTTSLPSSSAELPVKQISPLFMT